METDPLLEQQLRELRCGRVVARSGQRLITCDMIAEWVPFVHIRIPGHVDAHALMGGHAMCNSCRLFFKKEDLFNLSMWDSIVSGLDAEGIPAPSIKQVEIEWVDAESFLKQTDKRVQQ